MTQTVFELKRDFNAPLEMVYRSFTESDLVARWNCGHRYDNISMDIDAREGGVLHHRVRSKDTGDIWTFFGVYQEVRPQEKLVYTFDWKTDWREAATQSLVEISFLDQGERAGIEILHSQLVEEALPSTEDHWNEFIDLLEELLDKKELA
jgi:uncharacterized protein YndB with AHSA1/START domain